MKWRTAATVAIGIGLVALAATGRGRLFVRPWFVPVIGLTGVVVVVLAVRTHVAVSARGAAIILLPLLAALVLPPGSVGSVTANVTTSGLAGPRIGDPANPLLAGGHGEVTLLQIWLAEDQLGAVALVGRPVTTVGQVAGPHLLRRLVMVCCAADARPVPLEVAGAALGATGGWVSVSGTLSVDGEQPSLEAKSVVSIPAPANPIL